MPASHHANERRSELKRRTPEAVRPRRSVSRRFVGAFFRNRASILGFVIVLTFSILGVAAPWLSPRDPMSLGDSALEPPTGKNLMGTDDLGRDILSRFVFGARTSMAMGLLAAATSTSVGILLGALAGYYGAWVDDVLMRITESFLVIPRFFFALVVAVLFGPSFVNVALVIGLLYWPATCRLIRASFLSLREQEFVLAARALGLSDRRIMFREILPNALPQSVVTGSLTISQAILLEAGLSFLGLGDPSVPSWGLMINSAQRFLQTAWWMGFFPGLGILLASLGFNLMGDGLNDALNPKLRR